MKSSHLSPRCPFLGSLRVGWLPLIVSLLSLQQTSGQTVVAWGRDDVGQIAVPSGLSGVTAVAIGGSHSLVLKSNGTVASWGADWAGQVSIPAGLSGVSAITAGGDHSMAVRADGTVAAWGIQGAPTIDLTDVIAVSTGYEHSLALKGDGTVLAWGSNTSRESTVPEDLTGVIAVAAGGNKSLALKNDGSVVGWGDRTFNQLTIPSGLNGVVAIAAGGLHSLALKNDGTVVAWGYNGWGQTAVPSGLRGVVAIAAGGEHSLALKNDGTVVAWGRNDFGQGDVPAGLTGVVGIATGGEHCLALVQAWSRASAVAASGAEGSPFFHQIIFNRVPAPSTALSLNPPSYVATNLPAGLTLDSLSGFISGTPTTRGVYEVMVGVAPTPTEKLTISIFPSNPAYEAWRDVNWGFGSSGTGMLDDADDDGIVNLLEFLLGSNPTSPGPAEWLFEPQPDGSIALTVDILASRASLVNLRAHFSSDLKFGSDTIHVAAEAAPQAVEGDKLRYRFIQPTLTPRPQQLFARMSVTAL